jgi:hypothetical protein
MAVADESRYSMARCWRYLAIGFDDGVPARRDEEEADVLVEPREDMRFHRDLYRGVVVILNVGIVFWWAHQMLIAMYLYDWGCRSKLPSDEK